MHPKADGGKQKVKVKVRVNPDGIFVVLSASIWQYASAGIELPVSSNMQGQLSFVELKVYICILYMNPIKYTTKAYYARHLTSGSNKFRAADGYG